MTITTEPLPLYDWNEKLPENGAPQWWLDFIKARLDLELLRDVRGRFSDLSTRTLELTWFIGQGIQLGGGRHEDTSHLSRMPFVEAGMVGVVPPEMAQRFQQGGMGGMGAGRQINPEDMGKKFIAGEVKAINETKLTVARPDGQTQDIEVDENTSFKKGGESITLADIKVGDFVAGPGELKDNIFVAKELRAGRPRMGGMGNGQGRGQGTGAGRGNTNNDHKEPPAQQPEKPAGQAPPK